MKSNVFYRLFYLVNWCYINNCGMEITIRLVHLYLEHNPFSMKPY